MMEAHGYAARVKRDGKANPTPYALGSPVGGNESRTGGSRSFFSPILHPFEMHLGVDTCIAAGAFSFLPVRPPIRRDPVPIYTPDQRIFGHFGPRDGAP